MENIKTYLKSATKYLEGFFKWLGISILTGIVGGILGSLFHISIDFVTELRIRYGYLILLLPLGGVLIAWLYKRLAADGRIDTDRVIESVRKNKEIPIIMIPLIFISTVITHLFGGSAGREGAALQLGGSLGCNLGRLLKLSQKRMRIIIMSGMSSVFSALFGTPLTAAIFSIEVTRVGEIHYAGLVPCMVSSFTAYAISRRFGLGGVSFPDILPEAFDIITFGKVALLALLCAVVSILFCYSIKLCEKTMNKLFKSGYIKALVGGIAIVILTALVGSQDYNGAGMEIITRAIDGTAEKEAFILKILFTAITISAGFKGGEIVPAFFIGSTFGCVAAPLLGINPSFAAAIGLVTLFCCLVNCPIASIILSVELFGGEGLLFFALSCAVGYMMSGYSGLYHSQKILYSKLDDEYINRYTQ